LIHGEFGLWRILVWKQPGWWLEFDRAKKKYWFYVFYVKN
jgi:hypothetical protein